MNPIRIDQLSTCWQISAEDLQVTQCRLDYAFGLEFWISDGIYLSLRIQSDFLFFLGNKQYLIKVEAKPESMCPAIKVLHHKLEKFTIYTSGNLELAFESNMLIKVRPDPSFEAWTLAGTDGMKFVCLPGGEVAYWEQK